MVIAPACRQRALGRIPGQALRFAAGDGDHVDLFAAVVLAGERDVPAIRRKACKQFLAGMRREPADVAAVRAGEPQIAGVGEHDRVAVQVGEPEEARFGGGGRGGKAEERGNY